MKHKDTPNYAFLMIEYDTPSLIKEIQSRIKDSELYYSDENNKDDYGLEKETHVTIFPCLDNETDLDKLKEKLKPLEDYVAVISNISKFDCPDYDVLKCGVACESLIETNKEIAKDFDCHSEYKNTYQPHITIAYMKKGLAEKYCDNNLQKLIKLEPRNFLYSYYDNNGKMKKIKFE